MGAEPLPGRVVALQANYCLVDLDGPCELGTDGSEPGRGGRLLCTRRTRLDKSGLQVCVGDRVMVASVDWRARRGSVVGLEPRHNLLQRPAVANVSQVVVVASLAEPGLDPLQLTRFLITAEATGQPVQVVLSKADLLPAAEVEAWCRRLEGWGYTPVAVSTHTGAGLAALRRQLGQPGIAVLCGPSGVGKSSLLNALAPDLELRVAAVSGRLRRGRHTTRHVELFPLAPGALVADSPGFNTPALPSDPQILVAAFPELLARLRASPCRFANCRHQGDPGCAMGGTWDRHGLYGRCLEEVEALAVVRSRGGQGRQGEGGMRQRGDRLEPLLNPQLRRSSRSTRRQALDGELSSPDRED